MCDTPLYHDVILLCSALSLFWCNYCSRYHHCPGCFQTQMHRSVQRRLPLHLPSPPSKSTYVRKPPPTMQRFARTDPCSQTARVPRQMPIAEEEGRSATSRQLVWVMDPHLQQLRRRPRSRLHARSVGMALSAVLPWAFARLAVNPRIAIAFPTRECLCDVCVAWFSSVKLVLRQRMCKVVFERMFVCVCQKRLSYLDGRR